MINHVEKDHRQPVSVVGADEFDDEEAKMEKFYELIRSFNEARANHQRNLQQSRHQNHDYQVINLNNNNNNNNNKNSGINYNQMNDVINRGTKISLDSHDNLLPTFKWEDFTGVHHNKHDYQDQNQNQVVVSDKSGHDFLKNSSNFSKFDDTNTNNNDNNVINKKRIEIVDVDDDDDDIGDYRDEDDGINNADKVKISRPQIELDLNLAL